jgi:hypothetical protein
MARPNGLKPASVYGSVLPRAEAGDFILQGLDRGDEAGAILLHFMQGVAGLAQFHGAAGDAGIEFG